VLHWQVPPIWQSPLPLQPFPGQQEAPLNPVLQTQLKVVVLQKPGCGSVSQPGLPAGIVQPHSAFVAHPTLDSAFLPIATSARIVVATANAARRAQVRSPLASFMRVSFIDPASSGPFAIQCGPSYVKAQPLVQQNTRTAAAHAARRRRLQRNPAAPVTRQCTILSTILPPFAGVSVTIPVIRSPRVRGSNPRAGWGCGPSTIL